MRHTLLYSGLCLALVATASCSKSYDDAPLKGRVATIDKRITSLEGRLKAYNDELSKLEQVLQAGRYVRELRETKQGDQLVGYELGMSDGKTISLTLGKRGATGRGITMGVQQDPSDHKYYWRLNGEWLKNERGERIPLYDTEQTEGIKGFSPKLEIRDGAWHVQVAEGEWTRLDYPVQGPQGDPGELLPGLISSIRPMADQWSYELRLSDGSVLQLPRMAKPKIKFAVSPYRSGPFEMWKTYRVPFTIENPIPDLILEVTSSREASMRMVLTNEEKSEGYMEIEVKGDYTNDWHWRGNYEIYLLRGNRELLDTFTGSIEVEKERENIGFP